MKGKDFDRGFLFLFSLDIPSCFPAVPFFLLRGFPLPVYEPKRFLPENRGEVRGRTDLAMAVSPPMRAFSRGPPSVDNLSLLCGMLGLPFDSYRGLS